MIFKEIEPSLKKNLNILFTEHHISHASAFYPSNLKESAILTIDGVGEWCTASICRGRQKNQNYKRTSFSSFSRTSLQCIYLL